MKLSLGSGKKVLSGFHSVDLCPGVDFQRPIDDLSCFDNNSIDEIYSSHSLEYFDFIQAPTVLNEWNRVLSPNGLLRLSVPDFDKLLKVYTLSDNNIDKIIGPIFGRWDLNGNYIYHKCVYNRPKLVALLTHAAFSDIRDWDSLEFFDNLQPDYDDYSRAYFPHMDFNCGFQISLNILCSKR